MDRRLRERLRAAIAVLVFSVVGCSSGALPFPPQPPLWRDPDRAPFTATLPEYFSPVLGDAVDQSVLRPVARVFAVDPAGEALDVNTWDEVPDSSWFQNRIGRSPLTPESVARGPCSLPPLDGAGPWEVVSSKTQGADAGFLVKVDGHRYLIKLMQSDARGPRLCASDLAVQAAVVPGNRTYVARVELDGSEVSGAPGVDVRAPGEPCVALPPPGTASSEPPRHLVVELAPDRSLSSTAEPWPQRVRFHLYDRGVAGYLIAGIERPSA